MDNDSQSVRGSLNMDALFHADAGAMECAHKDQGVLGKLAVVPAPRLLDEASRICAGLLREFRACNATSTTAAVCDPRRATPAAPRATANPPLVLAHNGSIPKISAQRVELAQHHGGLMG